MLETHHHHQQQQQQKQRQQRVITSPFSSSTTTTCMDKSSSKPFELQPQTTFDSSTMTTTTTTTTCNEHNNSIGTTTTNSNSNQKVVTISAAQVSPQIHPQSSNLSTISTGSSNQTLMTSHLRKPTTTKNTTTQPRSLIPTSKRKASIPIKRPLHSITEAVNSTTPTQHQQRNKRSRQIAEEQSPDNHKITTTTTPRKTPTNNNNNNNNNITSPVPNTTSSSTKELMKSPTASSTTARITKFFTSASKKQANRNKSNNNNNNNNSEDETKSVTPSPSPSASNNLDGSEEVRKELERVRAQVAALEKKLDAKDKELEDRSSQLKAVNSSRTIYQGQLQKALQEREKQIEELKMAYDTLQNNSQTVIEKLVRREATREAKELRQTLASDGARLGRLVYSRGGYMQALESWEDGEESKSIKRRRQQLKEQRESLELKRQQLNSLNGSSVDTLGVLEAVKSLERKIRSVQKEELMYMKKDQDLALEKGAHIRSLKRVSSEDSSRFVSRPKVRNYHSLFYNVYPIMIVSQEESKLLFSWCVL